MSVKCPDCDGDNIPIVKGSALAAIENTNEDTGKKAILELMQKVDEHIALLDYKFRNLIKRLSGTDTTILITADHGLVDIPKKNNINLNKIPGFHSTLSTYLSGEGRAAYLFVRATKDKEFRLWTEECRIG